MLRRILLAFFILEATLAIAFAAPEQAVKPSRSGRPAKVPTFSDRFSGGKLDTSKWIVDTGRAPGNIPDVNSGTFSPKHVDLSTGMLRLILNQSISGGLATSVGSEIRSKQLFGYGTYVWIARAASTADTPKGPGSAVSGTVTDLFNFINDSESEIDFEYQGQSPSTLEMTNFSTVSQSQSTDYPGSGCGEQFSRVQVCLECVQD